jgi:hypothetical protein
MLSASINRTALYIAQIYDGLYLFLHAHVVVWPRAASGWSSLSKWDAATPAGVTRRLYRYGVTVTGQSSRRLQEWICAA